MMKNRASLISPVQLKIDIVADSLNRSTPVYENKTIVR